MAVTIVGPEYLLLDEIPDGQGGSIPNPMIADIEYLTRRAVGKNSQLEIDVENGVATVSGIEDTRAMPPAKVAGMIQLGCEVYGYSCFVKLTNAEMADGVPVYLENAYHVDPETGVQGALKTWDEWGGSYKRVLAEQEIAYVELNAGGTMAPGSVIAQLYAAGFTLMQTSEVIADIASILPPEPEV